MSELDAVIVGAGPNGLTAAATLARAGRRVLVLEAAATIGGGTRTEELTRPGFLHDVCSAIHPLAATSPAFADLPLAEHGLEWARPELALAHPLDDGTAATLDAGWDATDASLGADAPRWRALLGPTVDSWERLSSYLYGPLLRVPPAPLAAARFGLVGLRPAASLARARLGTAAGRALWAGLAAHAILPLEHAMTSAFALVLAGAGHVLGWPVARGGSQRIAGALASYIRASGGEIVANARIDSLDALPPATVTLLDIPPRAFARLDGDRLRGAARRRAECFRPGPAAFKVDYALDGPVPWAAAACRRAGTVHVGGSLEEVAAAERTALRGGHPDRPFVLVAQQSLCDPSRAPDGRHTLWAYCHVPNGSTVDMTDAIEAQIERFAPGFRDLVLARHTSGPADLERRNASMLGGDIGGGALDGGQLIARPRLALDPYRTALPGVYLCSASTPPGAGAHGLCGWHAARSALRRELRD